MRFPNLAGDHPYTDDALRNELKSAGIFTLEESEGKEIGAFSSMLRSSSEEVKTGVRGTIHGWVFTRAWYYWICKGPGIEIAAAVRLQESHGKEIRAEGDCMCRGPLFWTKGLACSLYHVDTAEGLLALANAIKEIVARSATYTEPVDAPQTSRNS